MTTAMLLVAQQILPRRHGSDGLLDGIEVGGWEILVVNRGVQLTWVVSDPGLADTDSDGLSDFVEFSSACDGQDPTLPTLIQMVTVKVTSKKLYSATFSTVNNTSRRLVCLTQTTTDSKMVKR